MVTARERFWSFSRYEPVDYVPYWGDWVGPVERWRLEGCPIPNDIGDDNERRWFIDYFGFEGIFSAFWGEQRVPVNIGAYPGLAQIIYEETPEYMIYRSGIGAVVKQFKNIHGVLHSTQWLKYPLANRQDWVTFRDTLLNPDDPGRYPDEQTWRELKQQWAQRDYVISIDGGSFYGFIRDWLGVQGVSMMLFDDPALIHEMVEYLADFYIRVLHRALHEVDVDFAMFWEDMCYKSGPLVSPAMFREFFLPGYIKVTSFLRDHGVSLSWVDCDGNIEGLIPLWLEGGVRGFYPLEVASDMDINSLQAQYGKRILTWGNVDKRALGAGKAAIDAEIARLKPAVERGGFIPLVDHGVPEDISYANYLYYLDARKKLTGYLG
ncbi:MAG: uroporphyrinogen decarboxylase family protein [Anaerolineae bacterium]